MKKELLLKEEVYTYKIGNDIFKVSFVDGEFVDCEFDFNGMYTKEEWEELAEVAKIINKIEHEKAKEHVK